MLAWDDTRNTDPTAADARALGGGLQDIYVSSVQYQELGGGTSKTAKIARAAVVGLLVVGLGLLAMSLLTRNKNGPAGSPSDKPAKAKPKAGVS